MGLALLTSLQLTNQCVVKGMDNRNACGGGIGESLHSWSLMTTKLRNPNFFFYFGFHSMASTAEQHERRSSLPTLSSEHSIRFENNQDRYTHTAQKMTAFHYIPHTLSFNSRHTDGVRELD